MRKQQILFALFLVGLLGAAVGGYSWWDSNRPSRPVVVPPAPLVTAGQPLPVSAPLTPQNAPNIVQLARLGDSAPDALSVSANGRWVAIGHANVGVAVYDAQTLTRGLLIEMPISTLFRESAGSLVAVADDGVTVAAVNGSVGHVRRADGSLLRLNIMDIDAVGLSPDGTTLLTVGKDLRVWRVHDGALLHTTDSVYYDNRLSPELPRLSFSADNSHVLVGTGEAIVHLRTSDGTAVTNYDGATARFLPNSTDVVVANYDGTVDIYSAANIKRTLGTPVPLAPHNPDRIRQPVHLAISSDGSLLATILADEQIRVMQASDGAVVQQFDLEDRLTPVHGLAFNSANSALFVLGSDGSVHAWDINGANRKVLAESTGRGVLYTAWDAASQRVTAIDRSFQRSIWQLADRTPTKLAALPLTARFHDALAHNYAMVTYHNGQPQIWRADDTQPPPETDGQQNVLFGSLTPDGKLVAVTGMQTDTVSLVRVADRNVVQRFVLQTEARDRGNRITTSISRDGTCLAASDGRTAYVWQLSDGALIRSFPVLARDALSPLAMPLALNANGTLLVTVSGGLATVWDGATGRQRATLATASDAFISTVSISPDDRFIATGELNGVLRLWGVPQP